MGHITIEYMIMIPVMILQIFLFPLAATIIMDNWTDSRQTLELQEVAGHLGSTIQQVYYTVNHVGGAMKVDPDIPTDIEGYGYTVRLDKVVNGETSYRIMNVTLCLAIRNLVSSTLVTLGGNINWQDNLTFNSTDHNLCLIANKTAETIILSVEGT